MRALTVRQPWAELIMTGDKDVENRRNRIGYRGEIAIHVSRTRAPASELEGHDWEPWVIDTWREVRNRGMVIGTVQLIDCIRDSMSDWAAPDCWHLVLAKPRRFKVPIMATGQLGLWYWNP
jgi:hypothetical protein